ncbi:MAG TPA: NnrS family protein [Candidatus Eisenbacteria bacterium]|nr:NnrS family protein [Candidatus Eisenbacteria bacterium]
MGNRIKLSDIGREPFRVFFPEGLLSGIIGVSLWPLHFSKLITLYPGQAHARIMAYGLFGGFIFGFLGTAMPRMLSASPLGTRNVLLLLVLHFSMLISFSLQKMFLGDVLFLAMLLIFLSLMLLRFRQRQDTPPPGFILVGFAFLCILAAVIMALFEPRMEEAGAYWIPLQRRLAYQGFVLLPILGIGPFILPRFFGLPSPHDFPEAINPSAVWKKKAGLAFGVGALIILSFFIESSGWVRTAYALRFGITVLYLLVEFPFRSAPKMNNALGLSLRISFAALVSGFILVAIFPAFRVSLLHLTLIGGFAVITFTVATRVMFGHSGNLGKLKEKNWWLASAVGLMLFAMATRISGDFWPKIMATHYSYGAVLWIIAALLWAAYTIPKVLITEAEG